MCYTFHDIHLEGFTLIRSFDGVVDSSEAYINSSAKNYLGHKECILDISINDFGVQEGNIIT